MKYVVRFNKNGNTKVGGSIWTFNKLAGRGILAGCRGTCGQYCSGCYNVDNPRKSPCYVFKSYVQWGWENSTVVKAHVRNTNAMREQELRSFLDLQAQIKRAKNKPSVIRLHSSGELETVSELHGWIKTALMFPSVKFYIYTKNYDVVNECFSGLNLNNIPTNFFINVSVWHDKGIECYNKWKHIPTIRAFVYCDKEWKYPFAMDVMCPAYSKEGKLSHDIPCEKCGLCFSSHHKICGCWSH